MWRDTTLGECAVVVNESVSPSELGETPYIGLEHIGQNSLALLGHGIAKEVDSTKSLFKEGDVLFGKLRPYFRKVIRAPFDGICSTDIWVIRPQNDVDARYLYYLMANQQVVDFATQGSIGTKMPRAKWDHVGQYPISLPPLPEQRRIAHILGTLDDKIELNRRMNQTLEQMTRAIFKDWFVDFGPVRAKIEGKDPYLPQDIWQLFPNRLIESELGQIPEGWKVRQLGDVSQERRHSIASEQIEPGTAYIGLQHMPKRRMVLSEWDQAEALASSKLKFLKGDILFGRLRPYFHKVGIAPIDGICSTDIAVISPKSTLWFGFVLGHASSSDFVNYTDAGSTGTKMPRTNWKEMSRYPLILPTESLAKAYNRAIYRMINLALERIHETTRLTGLRDALLPGLVSGEVKTQGANERSGS